MEFAFEIVHRAGIKQKAADILSRLHTNGSDFTMLEDDGPLVVVSTSDKLALTSSKTDAADGFHT